MKQRLLHIFLCLLMAFACQGFVSCVNDKYDDGTDADDRATAMLYIRTSALDSRASDSNIENMNSLRVIILHANGSVEQNYFVDNLSGAETHTHMFKVSRGEKKKIYLIANEGSMGTDVDLNNLEVNPARTLEEITFTAAPSDPTGNPELSKGIPMSACYELEVGNEPRIEKDFYVVRAMTKFTFTFQNGRTDNVTLKEMRVSAFANKTYLIPQFTVENKKVSSEKFMVDTTGVYTPNSQLFWIDWLKKAVDKSQSGQYTPDEIGWIKDYQVPESADYNTSIKLIGDEESVIKNSVDSWTYPKEFYRCESIYIPDSKEQQEYCISYLEVKADNDTQEQVWENLPILKLNWVKYLFRHTHVNVNVAFSEKNVVIFARIHPWIVIKPTSPLPLEPVD